MKKLILNLCIICISAIATVAISLSITDESYVFSNANSFVWIVWFVFFIFLIQKVLEIQEKRLYITSSILAFIMSATQTIGQVLKEYLDLSILINSKEFLCFSTIKFIGYFIIFDIFIILVYKYLNMKIVSKVQDEKALKVKSNIKIQKILEKKYTFFIIWGIIFFAYVPYFMNYFPGIMTPDSFSQFGQGVGIENLNNHHPIFHTFCIIGCQKIGAIFNNYNICVAIYSILQMMFLSGCFAFAVYYMLKKEVPLAIIFIFFAYYATYPVHALYSITMWKDIPFAATMLILTIMITDMALDKKEFFSKKWKMILITTFLILISLFRNNGIYVVLLSFPVVLFFNKEYLKKVIIIFGIVLAFYILWKGVFFKVMNIKDGSIAEALSIPMQQLARSVKSYGDEMNDEEKQEIFSFFYSDTIGDVYDPIISDPVKALFNASEFEQNKAKFIKVWLKNLIKYPGTYIESFLCNSYGYWYPEAQHWVVARTIYESDLEVQRNLNLHQSPIINLSIVERVDALIDSRRFPILSMLFSIGSCFYVVCIILGYVIYSKKYNLILIYIPIFMLWLTCLASPVFAEFRYIYSMFTCIPILCTAISMKKTKVEEK